MTVQHQIAAGAHDNPFQGLLSALRNIQPKCPDCGQPLDPGGVDVRARENEAGNTERVCRPCFNGEVAEMLMAHQPR